jgi:short subunit dehydrogenase-like uncharacterized protein
MADAGARIAIFGATGFTGRLVAEELARGGVRALLAGRSEAGLKSLSEALGGGHELRVGDPERPESLAKVFDGVRAVVNCAGPFSRLGEPVLRAAIEAGAHYLDTTGEQEWMVRAMERLGPAAESRGVTAIVAHAFEYAVGDCAARIAVEETPGAATVEIFNRVEGFAASRGTKKSALEALRSPCLAIVNGRLRREAIGAHRASVRFPDEDFDRVGLSFPGGEVLSAPRFAPTVRDVRCHLVMPPAAAAALPWLARLATPLLRGPLVGWLERRIDAGSVGPGAERRSQAWWVQARVRAPGGRGTRVTASGYDAYAITAVIAALGARWLCDGRAERTGVVTSALAFAPRAFLDALAPAGVAWRIDPL